LELIIKYTECLFKSNCFWWRPSFKNWEYFNFLFLYSNYCGQYQRYYADLL